MADEKKNKQEQGKKSGGRKRNRRRYFRRKKSGSGESQKKEGSTDGQKKPQGSQKRRSNAQRNRRRRRRSRSKSSGHSGPSIIQEIDRSYVPPESVFVYTHMLRPDQRDNFTFRSELASGTGRTLDDFRIDLSLIFPEDGDPIPQTAARSVERATAQYREERAQGLHEFDDELEEEAVETDTDQSTEGTE